VHSYIECVNGPASQTFKAVEAAENAGLMISNLSEVLEKVGSKLEVFMWIGTG